MSISTISTSTAGRITDCGTADTVAAPKKAMTKAAPAAGTTRLQSITTLRTKDRAANVVPQAAATLLVPSSAAGDAVGSTLNSAGIWISPPPPTAASIRPAAKANTQRMTISTMKSGSDDERFVRVQRHHACRVVDPEDAQHPAIAAVIAGGETVPGMQGLLVLEDQHVPRLQQNLVHDIGMVGGCGEQLQGKLRVGAGCRDAGLVVAAIQVTAGISVQQGDVFQHITLFAEGGRSADGEVRPRQFLFDRGRQHGQQ